MSDDLYCTLSRDNDRWYEFPWTVQPSWTNSYKSEIRMWHWTSKLTARGMIRRERARRKKLAGEGGKDRTVKPYRYPPEEE